MHTRTRRPPDLAIGATRAIGIADVLTPVQVCVFSDCEMRWFYEHLLAVPDPPTASMALDEAIRAALMTNFRHKLQCKEDLQTEAVVELFRRAWQKQQQAARFCDDEHPDTIGGIGEELVRIYMRRAAPPIQPVAIEQRTMRGVLASVRTQAQFDILDEDGMIIAINTARSAPSRIEPMHRFELTTCYRLADGASGVVRSDTLVNSESPQCISQVWEINEADIQLTDALYPVVRECPIDRVAWVQHRTCGDSLARRDQAGVCLARSRQSPPSLHPSAGPAEVCPDAGHRGSVWASLTA